MTTREKPKLPAELTPIVADLIKAGAKPYLVGGAVRDWLRGESPKDHDIEVYKNGSRSSCNSAVQVR